MRKVQIPLPPLSIQHAIAKRLSAYDALIENNTRRIAILENKAEQLYKEWFVRRRFPGHEKAKFTDGLPEGWKSERLGNLFPVVTGKKDANYSSANGKYKFFTCSKEPLLADGYSFDCFAIILAGNGDFNIKLYKGKFEAYQRTYVLSPFQPSSLFISYFTLKSELSRFSASAAGAVIKFLTKGMIEKVKIVVPDAEILQQFNSKLMCIYNLRTNLNEQNALLARERDLLLPRLMSGRLKP